MSSPYPEGGPPSGAPGGKTSLGLESNIGAALCYLANFLCCIGMVLAIVFLVTEKENRFVKFHALNMVHMSLLAWILVNCLRLIVFLIFCAIWLFAGIKAYGGQWYKLPFIGEFAWNTVNK